MRLKVLYTPHAKTTLNTTYQFISDRFGEHAANKFLGKAGKIVDLIALHPLMFKASGIDDTVRIGLITKQCSLFYRVTPDAIHLLFFWDNRQEPLLIY